MPVAKKSPLPKSHYRVGRSRTGLGLFAAEPIEKGAYIIEYTGPRVTSAKADELNNKYLFEISSRWTINGASRRNLARYANHSCRPNAESDVVRGVVKILAKRNIKPGEEITYNYGKDYFDTFLKPIGCKCPKCLEKRAAEKVASKAKSKAKAVSKAKSVTKDAKAKGRSGNSKARTGKTEARKTDARKSGAGRPAKKKAA